MLVDGASEAVGQPARTMRDAVYGRVLPPLAAVLIRALRSTWTLRVEGREVLERFAAENRRYVHVFWHAHILVGIYSYVGREIMVMISRHRDGELIARTVERFGYLAARGSTTEGGSAAFREMVQAVRAGRDICFTPDGPRGPARKVQPGTIAAARALGIPIVPVVGDADRAWRMRSWDRFLVPKPGARVLLACGQPLFVERGDALEDGAARLEREMEALGAFAAAHVADPTIGKPVGRLAGGRVG
ncbi:MAG: lysophospholipid acyltransferase family protein [Acidobacteria bacterium]|nr:lysophospholipid acyltransferase family protein [Acidobacteriota bacterium]